MPWPRFMPAVSFTATSSPRTSKGHLDSRYQKVVDGPMESTELFAVLDGRLFRHGREAAFVPGALVECVREFGREEIEAAMRFVRDKNRELTAWIA